MRHQRKKRIDKNAVMAIFIVVIMTSSIIGVVWSNVTTNNLKYKDYKFKIKGDYLSLKINGKIHNFYYLPTDIEHINLSNEIRTKIKSSPMIYITFNPESKNLGYIDNARFDLSNELQKTNIYLISGKTINSTLYTLPIITCDNSTVHVPVIHLKDSNITKLSLQDNCIIAESNSREGFIALKDRILYAIFDVI